MRVLPWIAIQGHPYSLLKYLNVTCKDANASTAADELEDTIVAVTKTCSRVCSPLFLPCFFLSRLFCQFDSFLCQPARYHKLWMCVSVRADEKTEKETEKTQRQLKRKN